MIVWIASYPRSGNTFFRTVLHGAFGLDTWSVYQEGHDGGGIAGDMTGHRAFKKDFQLRDAAESDQIYCVKTHDRPTDDGKTIYLLRDGRASIASYRHFLSNFAKTQIQVYDALVGRVMFGPWAAHPMAWHVKSRPNTLLIKFEDLVADPKSLFPQLEDFLRIKAKPDAEIPGFDQLRARNDKFFRSGTNEAWKQDFSEDDHDLFWALHGQTMAEFGYCQPGAEVHRAARGAWRLAGDNMQLRQELGQLTASRAAQSAAA